MLLQEETASLPLYAKITEHLLGKTMTLKQLKENYNTVVRIKRIKALCIYIKRMKLQNKVYLDELY